MHYITVLLTISRKISDCWKRKNQSKRFSADGARHGYYILKYIQAASVSEKPNLLWRYWSKQLTNGTGALQRRQKNKVNDNLKNKKKTW